MEKFSKVKVKFLKKFRDKWNHAGKYSLVYLVPIPRKVMEKLMEDLINKELGV